MFDPELYRDKTEVEQWKQRDPIQTYSARLRAQGVLDEPGFLAIEAGVRQEVEQAVAYAEAGALEPIEQLYSDVYAPQVQP